MLQFIALSVVRTCRLVKRNQHLRTLERGCLPWPKKPSNLRFGSPLTPAISSRDQMRCMPPEQTTARPGSIAGRPTPRFTARPSLSRMRFDLQFGMCKQPGATSFAAKSTSDSFLRIERSRLRHHAPGMPVLARRHGIPARLPDGHARRARPLPTRFAASRCACGATSHRAGRSARSRSAILSLELTVAIRIP
jgi:hypothetical protein